MHQAAILGCACRLPGAADEAAFWALLARGECSVSEIPADRWSRERFLHPGRGVPGRTYTFAAGVLDDVFGFDPAAFSLSPREAEQIDPQQRLLLELVREAFEDANIPLHSVAGDKVGVFVGASSLDNSLHFVSDIAAADAHFVTGNALSIVANRISHVFGFTGPSLTIDTACSSSLVAFDRAVKAIESGEIETAVVAGVNILASPFYFVGFSRAGMLSPTGRCRPFSGSADGYVRAEGGVVVVLSRLATAKGQGYAARGVVVGTGTNSDGRTLGIAMPESRAQQRLLEEIYAERGIDPGDLAFVEAHGTGTLVGDPAEARAVGQALGRKRSRPLPIGSVKSNIGHLEPASGLAGLLKSLNALERRELPASLHLDTLNEAIDFAALNLDPAARSIALGSERMAGVSSFGFGGTNAHAVLRLPEPDELPAPAASTSSRMLVLSAHSPDALAALAGTYAERLAQEAEPGRLAHAVAHGRSRLAHRLVISIEDPNAALKLRHAADGRTDAGLLRGVAEGTGAKVAFVFTGNGGQYAGMGRAAWRNNAAFRTAVRAIDVHFEPLAGWSMAAMFEQPPNETVLSATEIAQPLIFALEVGVARALMAAGCLPAAVLGHSVGEVAAAHIAGALDLAEAAHLIYWRSRLQGETRGLGTMAFLMATPERTEQLIRAAAQPEVVIAAVNAPNGVTIAGPTTGVDAVLRLARRQGVVGKRFGVDYPFHSPAMAPLEQPILDALGALAPHPAEVPFMSAVTGAAIEGEQLGARYWWDNIRQPVLFDAAVRAASQDRGIGLFVEIGPRAVLTGFLREILADAGRPAVVLASLQEKDLADEDPIERTLLTALVNGAAVDEDALFGAHAPLGRLDLPKTPWDRRSIRPPRTSEGVDLVGALGPMHPLLGSRLTPDAREWRGRLDAESLPYLADHKVGGNVVVPATALAEMVLAAGRQCFDAEMLRLEDFDILAALRLDPGESVETRVRMDDEGHTAISSRVQGSQDWNLHARGRVMAVTRVPVPDTQDGSGLTGAADRTLEGAALYAGAARLGLNYGPAFRLATSARRHGARIDLDLAPSTLARDGTYVLLPTVSDAALHGLVLAADPALIGGGQAYLPVRFAALSVYSDAAAVRVVLQVKRAGPRSLLLDITLFDAADGIVARIEGARLRAVALSSTPHLERDYRQSLVRLGGPRSQAGARVRAFLEAAQDGTTEDDALVLDALAYSIAYRAVSEIAEIGGATPHRVDIDALVDQGRLAAGRRPLLLALLDLLAEGGLAGRGEQGWSVTPQSDLPDPELLLREIAVTAPDRAAELALGVRLAADLAAHLRGTVEITHPHGLSEQWECASPAAHAVADCALELVRAATADGEAPLSVLVVERHGTLFETLRPLAEAGIVTLAVLPVEAACRPRLAARLTPSAFITLCEDGAQPAADLVLHFDHRTVADAQLRAAPRPGGALVSFGYAPIGFARLLGTDLPVPVMAAKRLYHARATLDVAVVDGLSGNETDRAPLLQGIAALAAPGATSCLITGHGHQIDPDAAALRAAGASAVLVHRLANGADAAEIAHALDQARLLLEAVRADADGLKVCLLVPGNPLGASPTAAALWAFGRTAINEYPDLDIRLVGLDRPLAEPAAIDDLAHALADLSAKRELVLDGAGLWAVRLAGAALDAATDGGGAMRLGMERPGSLDRLTWQPQGRRSPGAGEVEIEVSASALNFRDVMFAQGLIGDEMLEDGFAGATLGFECAGTVARLGEGTTGLTVGEPVVAFAPGALATHVTIPAGAVLKVPRGLGIEAAATLPVTFLTAWYGLVHCARLECGESVLIHGAAGGVGLAAMQIAKARGARVFATAGTPEKRALVKLMGAELVCDSRDTAFADILRAQGGCDVVLNSLAGRAMEESLRVLKPFGRFVELGKRDFIANTSIGLRPFAKNLTYFGVDADQLIAGQPKLVAGMLAELMAMFEAGTLSPLPYRTFAASEVRAAFRLLQGSGHIGKILVTPPRRLPKAPAVPEAFCAAPEGVHLVVGGTGGFGREAAKWLAASGARRIVVASRRGIIDPPLDIPGVEITAASFDVRDAQATADFVASLAAHYGRLAGVIHAAMVLDDALIRDLDRERFEAVLAPKVDGARNLDAATAGLALDYFVLFSSATTLVGNPGQSAYVAANAYMEGLARRRRLQGEPALAMAWGAISDVGVLARDAATSEILRRRLGLGALTAAEALDTLGRHLADAATEPVMSCAPIDWRAARELAVMRGATFAALRPDTDEEADVAAEADLAAMVEGHSDAEARAMVVRLLSVEVGRILRLPAASIDPGRALSDIGMDSLMALELDMEMQRRHKVALPMLGLGAGATLQDVAEKVLRKVRTPADAAGETDAEIEVAASPAIQLPESAELIDRHLHAQMSPAALESLQARVAAERRRDGSVLR